MSGLLTKLLGGGKEDRKAKVLKLKDKVDVAVLDISGPLVASSEEKSRYRYVLESLEDMKKIKPSALILRINSPGGTVGSSEEIYRAVLSLKREAGVKVVAMMEDVCASGGLYVAMAADRIVTKGGTITGSIGVILQGYNYQGVLDFLHLKTKVIKAGKFKDIMSPSREMKAEEETLLQVMADDVHAQFILTICESRGLSVSEVGAFADGRIMTGKQALGYKLVDMIGGYDDALREAVKMAEVPEGDEPEIEVWSGPSKDPLSKLGLSSHVSILDDIALNAKLSGLPLWMMPTFQP